MHKMPGKNLHLRALLLQATKRSKERVHNRRRKSLWIASTYLICWYPLPISKTKAHTERPSTWTKQDWRTFENFCKLDVMNGLFDDAVFRRRSMRLVILIVTYLIQFCTGSMILYLISKQLSILETKPGINLHSSLLSFNFITSFCARACARVLPRELHTIPRSMRILCFRYPRDQRRFRWDLCTIC